MPTQGYTFTPEYTSDEAGNPQFTGEGTLAPSASRFAGQSFEGVYHEDELTGERQYLIEESDYQQDEDWQPDIDAQYEEAIAELYPQLPQALEWMSETLPQELIDDYNQAVDENDYDTLMPLLEELMESYYEQVGDELQDVEQTDPFEDDSPIDQEEVDLALDNLQQQDVLGEETAYEFMQAAVEAQENGDVVLRDALAATASYHRGEADATELITDMMDKYDMKDLRRVYRMMTQEN